MSRWVWSAWYNTYVILRWRSPKQLTVVITAIDLIRSRGDYGGGGGSLRLSGDHRSPIVRRIDAPRSNSQYHRRRSHRIVCPHYSHRIFRDQVCLHWLFEAAYISFPFVPLLDRWRLRRFYSIVSLFMFFFLDPAVGPRLGSTYSSHWSPCACCCRTSRSCIGIDRCENRLNKYPLVQFVSFFRLPFMFSYYWRLSLFLNSPPPPPRVTWSQSFERWSTTTLSPCSCSAFVQTFTFIRTSYCRNQHCQPGPLT